MNTTTINARHHRFVKERLIIERSFLLHMSYYGFWSSRESFVVVTRTETLNSFFSSFSRQKKNDRIIVSHTKSRRLLRALEKKDFWEEAPKRRGEHDDVIDVNDVNDDKKCFLLLRSSLYFLCFSRRLYPRNGWWRSAVEASTGRPETGTASVDAAKP